MPQTKHAVAAFLSQIRMQPPGMKTATLEIKNEIKNYNHNHENEKDQIAFIHKYIHIGKY